MNKDREFIKELRELLEKYDGSIGFSVGDGSDTHGLYDEKLYIDVRDPKGKFLYRNILEVSGWTLCSSDLSTKNMV